MDQKVQKETPGARTEDKASFKATVRHRDPAGKK